MADGMPRDDEPVPADGPAIDADHADEADAADATGSDSGHRGGEHGVEGILKGASDLGAYIRSQREGARLSLRKLAIMAGVSNPYLSQIERGLRNPSAEILQGIARALEISSETLYVRAGLLDEVEPEVGVEDAISQARELTDPQKVALIEMYRSFRRLAALDEE